MLWVLQVAKTEPITSVELHLRLDQHLWSSKNVGGYLKGHPLMKSRTSHTHIGITRTIVWITEPLSV